MCEQSKDKVLKCYYGNPDHTLNCSIEAKEYMECVEKARQVGWSARTLCIPALHHGFHSFYIRDCYRRHQPVNSVYIVSVNHLYINTSHALLIQEVWRVGAEGMCAGVGLELSSLYMDQTGRQVHQKHG